MYCGTGKRKNIALPNNSIPPSVQEYLLEKCYSLAGRLYPVLTDFDVFESAR